MQVLQGLRWHQDLPSAIAEATRTDRRILSLRLLGRLDEELSCANSRFFRRMLYPDPRVDAVLRERFVLHWESVRAVPMITIDFGNGRMIRKPITGNSVHLVLDPAGRPLDALPGLFDPATFLMLLEGHPVALPPPAPHRAIAASQLAMSKHVVELPLLRAILPPSVADDTRTNVGLHARVREAFAKRRPETRTVAALVDWVYRELFLMPPDDPMLGLDVPDPV